MSIVPGRSAGPTWEPTEGERRWKRRPKKSFYVELSEVASALHSEGVSADEAVERIDMSHHAEHLPASRVGVPIQWVTRMYMVLEGTHG